MEKRARAFRAEVEARGSLGPRGRYTDQMRAEAIAYARERLAAGASVAAITEELGLGRYTLRNWLAATDPVSTFRTVEIASTDTAAPAGLIVHGPCGLRLEVHDVGALAALLRMLA